jgi:hypothetical protein
MKRLFERNYFIRLLLLPVLLLTAGLAANADGAKAGATEACNKTYKAIFSKSTVKIRVVFGYKDARPARFVGDRHERVAFVQRLLEPCTGSDFACGFTRSPKNSDLFAKTVVGTDERSVQVRLWVVNSSVGSDDAANRDDPFQSWRSHYAAAAFYTGVSESDIVLYNGHSRFGGGPDFSPPRLAARDQIDAGYYIAERPGISKLLESLKKAQKSEGGIQAKVLGLYSCSSSQHFTQEINQTANLRLLSSRKLVYYADALEDSLSDLSNILQVRCPRR